MFAGDGRIDRDHAIAVTLEELHYSIARPVGAVRCANHGNCPDSLKKFGDIAGIG
jgi:hypothetical protein